MITKEFTDRRNQPRDTGRRKDDTKAPVCGANGCDLLPEHKGPHNADCGCINGCKAWECPNL